VNSKSKDTANGPLDIEAVEEKRKRVLAQIGIDGQANPHVEEYRSKLQELFTAKTNSRDNFINWITGLATGSMFLALSNLNSTPPSIRLILLLSAVASFIGIIFAILFKVLLDVRFIALELEVEILKTLYDGHDLNTRLNAEVTAGKVPGEADKQKFLRNMDQSLDILDKNKFDERHNSPNFKTRLLAFSFWAAIGMFTTGLFLMVLRYTWCYASNASP
jgi:hypothetical protein